MTTLKKGKIMPLNLLKTISISIHRSTLIFINFYENIVCVKNIFLIIFGEAFRHMYFSFTICISARDCYVLESKKIRIYPLKWPIYW